MSNYTLVVGSQTYNLRDLSARGSWGLTPQSLICSCWGGLTGGQTLAGIQFNTATVKRDGTTLALFKIRDARFVRDPILQTHFYGLDARSALAKPFESTYGDIRYYINTNLTTIAAAVASSSGLSISAESYAGISLEIVFANCGEVLLQAALSAQKEIGFRHESSGIVEVKDTVGTDRTGSVTVSNSNTMGVEVGASSVELFNEIWSLKDTGFLPVGALAKDSTSQSLYGKWRIVKIANQILETNLHSNFVEKIVTDLKDPLSHIFVRTKGVLGAYPDDKVNVNLDDATGTYRVVGASYFWNELTDEIIIYELRKMSYILSNIFIQPRMPKISQNIEMATKPEMPVGTDFERISDVWERGVS